VIVGAFQVNPWVALGATMGMVLGAAYMLYLYRRVVFGPHHAGGPARAARPQPARIRGVRAADPA
jgi:NADH:ubiquinone oxidoreductase subunit 4 (subunit M)